MFLPMTLSYLLNSIGSYNGLVVNRQYAITWSNDDTVHCHMISVITMDSTHWFPIPLMLLHVLTNGPLLLTEQLHRFITLDIMMTASNRNIFYVTGTLWGNSPVTGEFPPQPHKGQWRGTLMFSLISAWANGWVKNWDAGDLRRHRAHYGVTLVIADIRRQGYAITMVADVMSK